MKKEAGRIVAIGAVLYVIGSIMSPRMALGCEECSLRKQGTYLGQFTLLGNGTVRTWVKYGANQKPVTLGITFSENALSGLPETPPPGMLGLEHMLALPEEAKITGLDHVAIDWMPKGHVPNGVYDRPHFDIHFHMSSREELKKITLQGADKARGGRQPDAKFLPAGYIMPPGTEVPFMGSHAIDGSAPELQGKPFTHTFLYGYYDGKVNFLEPMISKDFLESKTDITIPIKQPTVYQKTGYYPTSYSIKFDQTRQEYSVTLDNLTLRKAPVVQPTKMKAANKTTKNKPIKVASPKKN